MKKISPSTKQLSDLITGTWQLADCDLEGKECLLNRNISAWNDFNKDWQIFCV